MAHPWKCRLVGWTLAVSVGLLLALPTQRAQADAWQLETVEVLPPAPMHLPISLALDDRGFPHLVYMRDEQLVHAFKSVDSWTTEIVDAQAGSPPTVSDGRTTWTDCIRAPQVATGSEAIHVAYFGSPHGLRHAAKCNGLWSSTLVDERASSATQCLSLTVDAAGNACVSYGAYPSHPHGLSLKYGHAAAGAWELDFVESKSENSWKAAGNRSAVCVDGEVPHMGISSGMAFQYTIQYVSRSTEWFIETISEDGGEMVAIALDTSGVPHLAWAATGVLYHAWRVGSDDWRLEEIPEPAEPTWSMVALAIDNRDNVHIAHVYDSGLRSLVRAASGSWVAETVDEDALAPCLFYNVSMAVDDQGKVHIAYAAKGDGKRRARLVKHASRSQ